MRIHPMRSHPENGYVVKAHRETPWNGLTVVVAADALSRAPGLSEHLATDRGFPVVPSAASGEQLCALCQQLAPSILVAREHLLRDTRFPEILGNDFLHGRILVLAVIENEDPATYRDILRMGCVGGVHHNATADVFERSLRAVREGEIWAPRRVVAPLLRQLLVGDSSRRLTSREREVLALIASGFPNQEIADRLCISRETVRWHIRALYGKLGVGDRSSAIEYAVTAGLAGKRPAKSEVLSKTQLRSAG